MLREEHVAYDARGRIRERSWARDGGGGGTARSYDANGWLRRTANYQDGHLHGDLFLYGDAGEMLCLLDLADPHSLEDGLLSAELREAFATHGLPLCDDATVAVEDPGCEYLIVQVDQTYSLRRMGALLAVYLGRVVRTSYIEDGWIVRGAQYKGGRLHGEVATFGPAGPPLFTLDLPYVSALVDGNVRSLQAAFNRHGQELGADAFIVSDVDDVEWRVMDTARMVTVHRAPDCLTVHAGRLTRQMLFDQGWLMSVASYQNGRLDGDMTLYGAVGEPLCWLDRTVVSALDAGHVGALGPLFQQHGLALAGDATLASVVEAVEWFIAQPGQTGQTYTIRRVGDRLGVFPGRVQEVIHYTAGRKDGATLMYADGLLTHTISFHADRLDGPLTLYAEGRQQATVTLKDGQQVGAMTTFDDKGQARTLGSYQAGRLDGDYHMYHDGKLLAVVPYKEGKQHGRFISYHPNGRAQVVASYKDGLLDGEQAIFDEQGQPIKTSMYQAGRLHGEVTEYYPNGKIRQVARYKDDQLHGEVCHYDERGTVKAIRHYQDGEHIGTAAPNARASIFGRGKS